MALKTLLLRKKLDEKQKALEELRAKDTDFITREAELEADINEAAEKEELTDEERSALDEAVEKFDNEKKAHEEAKGELENEIRGIEEDLEAEEKEQSAAVEEPKADEPEKTRKDETKMNKRNITLETRDRLEAFVKHEDVQDFIGTVRTAIKEKRTITNAGLTIPERILPMLKERVRDNSKLMDEINVQSVSGTARQVIMGSIPEAVWTEACGILNELDLAFNDVEVDGYKVGGYFAVCNAVAEDNDVDLLNNLLDVLAIAIAKAVDKAIIYGTGVKMPLGIVTRLAQTAEPAGYSPTARTWTDLHTSNIVTGSGATGAALIAEIVGRAGLIEDDYADNMIWIMNHKTAIAIRTAALTADGNGRFVAGIGDEMPAVGGRIVELPFMPDNNVIVGYGKAYLLAERAGNKIESSEHARFIEDQIVLKGTARYDGQPSIAEAFALFTITNTAPTTSAEFAEDTANETESV